MLIKLISLCLLVTSCISPRLYERPVFYRQRLVVRKAHPGKLTNQICVNRKGEECAKWDLITYDMHDAEFRRKANDASMVCSIAGKRWRICVDRAGYCRRECIRRNKYSFKCYKYKEPEPFIPVTNHKYLYDSETVCRSYRK